MRGGCQQPERVVSRGHGRLAGTLIHCVLLRKQTFSFSSVTVKNRVKVRVSSRVRV